ncbi:MAG: WD40 repeat domain-containing serine/threonine protein kinase, partial [Planctomycetota bacterium]
MSRPQPSIEDLAVEYERVAALGDSEVVEAELKRVESRSPELGAALRRRFALLDTLRSLDKDAEGGAGRLLAGLLEPAGSDELRAELLAEIESDTLGISPQFVELDELARGGMSEILRVWDPALKRELALKRLAPHGDPEREPTATQVRRFIDEARITGTLEHPSIVPVHHFGLDPRGRLYFTMQRVLGPTLAEVIDLSRRGDAVWTLPRVVRALLAVCESVAFAHDQRVIHRDIKPSNIKVGRFGEIYLLDWGVARRLDADDTPTPDAEADALEREDGLRTASGVIVGTPSFMAPEQALGMSQPHPRTDVYSLGAVLYQLLSGEPPYGNVGQNAGTTLERVLAGPPAPLSQHAPRADAELVSICERAMAREPSVRYVDARDLAQDLHAWLDGRVVRAHASGALAEFGKWTRRNRLAAASLAAVIVGSIAVALWMTRSNEELRVARSDADVGRELARESERNARMIAAASAADSGELLMAQRMLDATPEKVADWEWRHLALRVDSSERVLADVGASILSAELVLEPPALVVACADGSVRWLDLATGAQQREPRVRAGAATALAFAPEADRCFVGREDGALEVFTLGGERIAESPPSIDAVAVLACTPDGRLVIAGHGDRKRRYHGWLQDRGVLFPLWDREGRAHAVTFIPGTRTALIGARASNRLGESVTLVDGLSGAWLGRCGDQGERLYDLELSPDGERLAVLSWDGTLSLRRLYESEPLWSVEHKGPEGRPFPGTSVAFERGGDR